MAMPFRNDPETFAKRLADKSIWEPNSGCLLWEACHDKYGHGKLGIRLPNGKPKTVQAHRLAYELVHGTVPSGLVVRHKCDVPACINVDHLVVGTQADNLADMWERGRARPAWIPPDARSNSKLTWETVRFIRSSTASAKSLARLLGVSDVAVGRVRNGVGWKEITQ